MKPNRHALERTLGPDGRDQLAAAADELVDHLRSFGECRVGVLGSMRIVKRPGDAGVPSLIRVILKTLREVAPGTPPAIEGVAAALALLLEDRDETVGWDGVGEFWPFVRTSFSGSGEPGTVRRMFDFRASDAFSERLGLGADWSEAVEVPVDSTPR